jgi:hypothetical protein
MRPANTEQAVTREVSHRRKPGSPHHCASGRQANHVMKPQQRWHFQQELNGLRMSTKLSFPRGQQVGHWLQAVIAVQTRYLHKHLHTTSSSNDRKRKHATKRRLTERKAAM